MGYLKLGFERQLDNVLSFDSLSHDILIYDM